MTEVNPPPPPSQPKFLQKPNTIPVVYNACYGGFGLKKSAVAAYNEKRTAAGLGPSQYDLEKHRSDPHLVEVVCDLGFENSWGSDLKIYNVPYEYAECYRIDEYDGNESVVCDPKDLIAYKLSKLNLEAMSDAECRTTLQELITLQKETYREEY